MYKWKRNEYKTNWKFIQSLPRKRVVENQPQSASENVQFSHPLLLPPPIEIRGF